MKEQIVNTTPADKKVPWTTKPTTSANENFENKRTDSLKHQKNP
jgi:hypothetical protein